MEQEADGIFRDGNDATHQGVANRCVYQDTGGKYVTKIGELYDKAFCMRNETDAVGVSPKQYLQ